MPNTNNPVEEFQQLYNDVKEYIQLQTEYTKVSFVEKLSILISAMFIIFIAITLIMAALFYLSFALAYLLQPIVGSLTLGFIIVSGLYLVLATLLFVYRKTLIVNPIVRFLSHLFLKDN